MASLRIQAPSLSSADLEAAARRLFKKFRTVVGYDHICSVGVRFEDLYRLVTVPMLGIRIEENQELGEDESGQKILGVYTPGDRVAQIDACLAPIHNDPRRAFTLWHEVVGHGMLQTMFIERQVREGAKNSPVVITDVSLSAGATSTLEWQANTFASRVAVPTCFRDAVIQGTFRTPPVLRYGGPGLHWFSVDGVSVRRDVASFSDFCLAIAGYCASYFPGLSLTALGRRMGESRLVVDLSGARRRLEQTSPGLLAVNMRMPRLRRIAS